MDTEKTFERVREMIGREMDNVVAKNDLNENSLGHLYKMVDILKDMSEIEMTDAGYSQRYMYDGNSYRGNMYRSNANSYRGSNSYRGNSYRNNYYNGGYSRTGDHMERLQRMMDEAQTEQEREAIRRVMEQM